jgi:hypothetical protein
LNVTCVGEATVSLGPGSMPLFLSQVGGPVTVTALGNVAIDGLRLSDKMNIETGGGATLEIAVLEVAGTRGELTAGILQWDVSIRNLVGSKSFELVLNGPGRFSLANTSSSVARIVVDRLLWGDDFAFNAIVRGRDNTNVTVRESVDLTSAKNLKIVVTPIDVELAQIPEKLVFFQGNFSANISVEISSSSDLQGFSNASSAFEQFHERNVAGLPLVRDWGSIVSHLCVANSGCPPGFTSLSSPEELASYLVRPLNVTKLHFLIGPGVIPDSFVFDVNVESNFTGIGNERVGILLSHETMLVRLSLENVTVTVNNVDNWNGSVGSLLRLRNAVFSATTREKMKTELFSLDCDEFSFAGFSDAPLRTSRLTRLRLMGLFSGLGAIRFIMSPMLF